MIETFDKPDSTALRKQTLDAHLDYLEANKHLLLACGDKRTDDNKRTLGGLYLVDLPSRQEASLFIAADPYAQADLFERVTILRWNQAFLAGRSLQRRRFSWKPRLTQK